MMLNGGAWVGPLVLVGFLLPERGAGCIYISVEKAGRRMLHMVQVTEKQPVTAEIIRIRLGSCRLSSQKDLCPVLHPPQKPLSFLR